MEAVLKIYGDIGESLPIQVFDTTVESENTSATIVSQFLDDNKDADSITVRINSRGGDVQEGWAIYDLLTNSGKKIKTIGEGKVYSIATIIFLAGTERLMLKNADGLIHNPYIPQDTLSDAYNSGDLAKLAESLRQEEEKILNFYIEKTGADATKLAMYMKDDTKLSAEDMLSLGFATKILEPVKAYAYIKFNNNSMDEKDVKTFGEKLDTILDKIKNFSRLPVTDQTLTDKDGKEVKLEKETGAPAVGDKATPDGTFVMTSGKKITVANGVISEISEDETELDKANKKIAELEAKVAAAEVEKTEAIAAKAEAAKKEADAVAIFEELKALKNSWKPEARVIAGEKKQPGKFDINRVKELTKKLDKETIKTE
jgi:ATP-dependent protease ClpP protease subunit